MDVFSHALYGATVCSRTGFAGGRRGTPGRAGRHWMTDWTVWVAALFGVLPDVLSLGLPFLPYWFAGRPHEFFRDVGPDIITRYRYMHSLLVALAAAGVLRLVWRPLGVPALAWALHVAMDSVTHGAGKFQTTVFYPLSTWSPNGIRWWEHPWFILAYWLLLPVLWLGLWAWRRRPPPT